MQFNSGFLSNVQTNPARAAQFNILLRYRRDRVEIIVWRRKKKTANGFHRFVTTPNYILSDSSRTPSAEDFCRPDFGEVGSGRIITTSGRDATETFGTGKTRRPAPFLKFSRDRNESDDWIFVPREVV